MTARYFAIGVLALATSMAASSALAPLEPRRLKAGVTPGGAPLYVIGTRGAQQRQNPVDAKLDSVLADLSRHAVLARPDHRLADLHSLSPAALFRQSAAGSALVLIDATTRGDPEQLKSALLGLGLEHAARYLNDVGGWLPLDQLEAAAARGEVLSIRATMSHRRAAVATQGDYAERSDVVRATYPTLTGAGVTVGVISDSFNCYAVYAAKGVPASGYQGYAYNGFTADYASDVSTGALPANLNVLAEPEPVTGVPCLNYQYIDNEGQPLGLPYSDEGRAMLQIVHDVAPGASLAFRTGSNSEADFANGIGLLQKAGAKIIADDLGYYDEPFFQDGLLAQAVDAVEAQGVAYFSAAGNDQETPSYQNLAPSFSTPGSGANAGERLLNFDTTGATNTTTLPVTIPALFPGDFVAVVVEWDQPYVTGCTAVPTTSCTGASSQMDVCITGAGSGTVVTDYDNKVTSCSGPNALGADPYQVMIIANPANAAGNTNMQTVNIVVGLANGTAPGRLIVAVEDDGQGSIINQFATNGPTLQGHPGAAGAAAVGAAFYFDAPRCGTTPATLESYSSAGGAPILFDTAGTRLATPIIRQKPDFVGPDGVNNTFEGFTLASDSPPYPSNGRLNTTISECQNNPSYPNFFGTSAATPHAAAIAALMLQANSALSPAEIYGALRNGALPMSSPSPNFNSGYGFIQADVALATIAPGAPSLTLAVPSIALGKSTTISWSSPIAASCTATGSWSATLAASGSQTLTPAATGTDTYMLTCSNKNGTSTASSAALTVTDAPSSGGGGALGGLTLLGLASLRLAWALGARRPARAGAHIRP